MPSSQARRAVVTGGTTGIGLETARVLLRQGWQVTIVGRDGERGAAALASLRHGLPGAEAELRTADLADLSAAARLGRELAALPRIDVLINNAGSFFWRHEVNPQGLERTFALNHMAYFILANALTERLRASAPARIVNVASEAHRGARIDFDDLQGERRYGGWNAYRVSKLCNILHAGELARRLAGSGVTANSLHPGFVASRFGDAIPGLPGMAWRLAKRVQGISPEAGAATPAYLASAAEVATTSGAYFADCKAVAPSPEAQDEAAAARLWAASERLAAKALGA